MKTFALFFVGLFSAAAFAGPADYVYTPNVEYGEREIDFKFGSGKLASGDKQQADSIGFGYGATEYWFTEVYLKYEREGSGGHHLDALEFENKFQLTETGKYPVDIGFITEIEVPRVKGGAYEFRFGPLFQTEFGKLQLNGNLLLERKYRGSADVDPGPHNTEIGYQWQIKYRWLREFEYGLQGFGEMGKWDAWDARDLQNHRIGPAVFGKIGVGNHQTIVYNAAWLRGVSRAAPDNTFRMQVEYEF
jgi:hypothetical protein